MTGRPTPGDLADSDAFCRDSAAWVLERVRRIPDEFRRFTVPEPRVRAAWRQQDELVDRLLSERFPAAVQDGVTKFDPIDLCNVELYLGLTSVHTNAMKLRARALSGRPRAYQVQYLVDLDHTDAAQFEVLSPQGWTSRPRPADSEQSIFQLVYPPPASPVWFVPPVAELFAQFADFDFFALPPPVRGDLDFARTTRLLECRSATSLLVDAARARGIHCRPAFGLLLSLPFSVAHAWPELLVDGKWVAADPVLLRAFVRWGLVDELDWPVHRSPAAIMARLSDRYEPVVRAGAEPVAVSFPTRAVDP